MYMCMHMFMCMCIFTCAYICRWLRINVLSNRHSPTYESIRDYLYFMFIIYFASMLVLNLSDKLVVKSERVFGTSRD